MPICPVKARLSRDPSWTRVLRYLAVIWLQLNKSKRLAKGILTQRALDVAQPKAAMYPMKDGVIPGLRCLVHPTGKKVFRLSRRLNGKLTHFTVGEASTMTLGESRAVAKAFIGDIDAERTRVRQARGRQDDG